MWFRKKKQDSFHTTVYNHQVIDEGSDTLQKFDERTAHLLKFPFSDICIKIQHTRYAIARQLPLEMPEISLERQRIEQRLLPIKIEEMKILREELRKLLFFPLTRESVTDKTE